MLTDADIRALLAGKLLLDGSGAQALAARGFAPLIGCRAESWTGPVASLEILADGSRLNVKPAAVKLASVDPAAKVLSTYHHRTAALAEDSTPVGTGAIRYRNSLGGDVIVMASVLPRDVVAFGGFYFYNETRKAQVLGYLRQLGYDAPYYPGDAEILVKWGRDKSGNRLLAILDTGHDPLAELPLVFPTGACPTAVERLGDDGRWRPVPVRAADAGRVTIASPVDFIVPAVFRMKE